MSETKGGEGAMDVTCPECDGKKVKWCHTNPGGWRWVRCLRCDGRGLVSPAVSEAYAAGQARMADRKARGLSLREEAARLGIKPVELSDLEWAWNTPAGTPSRQP